MPGVAFIPRTACLLACLALAAPALGQDGAKGRVVDRIAAVIGSDIILASEAALKAAPQLTEFEKAGGDTLIGGDKKRAQLLRDALEKLIDAELVKQQAVEMKITVAGEEVDRAIENIARENNVDVETLRRAVVTQGMDYLAYRNNLRDEILRFKVLNLRVRGRVKISDAEARQYYNDQVREIRVKGTFEGAHVLVRVPEGARPAEVAAARKKAEAILTRVRGGERFEDVARAESDDKATVEGGGSLGLKSPGQLPKVLDREFLDMEPGEVAGPIRTAAGFHVLKLVSREALGVQKFSEVKDRIMSQLAKDAMARQEQIWLKELRLKTYIEILL
ncbi:MAG: peptidylprolyl isomerase [Deltaproteobacteria bacterium]|nr:peptidylprolyl isomerase [Deltaproteobacteria bacterium]